MNGKQCKKIRALAINKAKSSNETTTKGAIRSKKYGTFQRILNPYSLKAIVKNMKRLFTETPRPQRHEVVTEQFPLLIKGSVFV